jgi:hypothetical protein
LPAAATVDELLQGLDPDAADALVREYLAEAALRRHLRQVHDGRYASDRATPRELFRIG